MKLKSLYLVLCIVGVVLPYWQFIPWVADNGLNMPLFFHQLFANRISAFFAMDVVVSAVTLLVFARSESSRLGRWGPTAASDSGAHGWRFSRAATSFVHAGTESGARLSKDDGMNRV